MPSPGGEPAGRTARPTYPEWLHAVDTLLRAELHITTCRLPGHLFRDAYEQGRIPRQVADQIHHTLRNHLTPEDP